MEQFYLFILWQVTNSTETQYHHLLWQSEKGNKPKIENDFKDFDLLVYIIWWIWLEKNKTIFLPN